MNCPDCDTMLHGSACSKCGWVRPKERAVLASWELPKYERPTTEEHAGIKTMIAEVTSKLTADLREERERKALAQLPKRCPACDEGKFVHMHVRYCKDCYLALGKASA